MCEIIPIEMGNLPPHVRRVALRAYQDVTEAAIARGELTVALRNDIAFLVVEAALNGDRDYGELKTAALSYTRIENWRLRAFHTPRADEIAG